MPITLLEAPAQINMNDFLMWDPLLGDGYGWLPCFSHFFQPSLKYEQLSQFFWKNKLQTQFAMNHLWIICAARIMPNETCTEEMTSASSHAESDNSSFTNLI